ncbi:hypothetical protein [Mangrovimonas sp. YM274]|uniref:hypothetical protein n=1 Tax=Mangrovimonas sp. YM274 TaxID=3070660 RepID=UPI0027DDF532|nr:hypothetical protein [Mangrovimonas sp. YM274]WMI68256.1 hypothetical protein RBH95_14035 [Mangrovimonas sp. YM274]
MKIKITSLFLILFAFYNCQNNDRKKSKLPIEKLTLIPINYKFDKLKFQLNSSLSDSTNKGFWKWNHLASPNGKPDTLGIEYYKNLEQPIFEFEGQETLPVLYALTEKGKLVQFSAIYIFNLPNQEKETKDKLFDKLNAIDLLKENKIRLELIENGIYKRETDQVIERIELEISKEKNGYDRITYEIKNATQHSV